MHKTVRMQDITPAIATKMLAEMNYDRQRGIRLDHVHFLAHEMKEKRFTSNTIGICELPGGSQFLVNGYHTLMAIVEVGLTQQLPVQFFSTKTHQDVAKVYARMDKQLRRTRADTIRTYGLEDSFELPPSTLSKYAAASVIIMHDFATGGSLSYTSDDEVILFMMDWLEHAKKFLETIKETPLVQEMVKRPVFPIGLMTMRYSGKAPEFWSKVATDDGLAVGDPRKTLHQWLRETGMTQDSSRKKIAPLPVGLRAVATAWNAYTEGRELKSIRVMNTTLPVVVRDSPYDPKWSRRK